MDLGEEDSDAQAQVGDAVPVAVRDPFDQAMQAQPAQVIGRAPGGVGVGGHPQGLGHPGAQGGVAESFGQGEEQTQGGEQRQDPRIIEVQAGGALAGDHLRLGDLIEHPFGQEAVLADGLDLEQPTVGGKADGPQGGQVGEVPSEPEVAGVIDRGLGAQGPAFLEVLLDLGGFIADVQRGDNPLGNNAGMESPQRALGNPPVEDQAG